MIKLKKRYKLKLKEAKKLKEKIGDPIAFGRSIIEIPEDQVLKEYKGYKYV